MKSYLALLGFVIVASITGCQKSITEESPSSLNSETGDDGNKILVDASKDGGVWWFPQSPETGFSESIDHQGKLLADYLRSLGYEVDELPRGAVITDATLENYSRIIRGPAFFPYTDDELAAYKNFLKRPGSIMLLQDHLSYTTNDKLSEFLGIQFRGAVSGAVTNFTPNDITNGVAGFSYIAGAVVVNASDNPHILVLGWMKKGEYTILDNGDPFGGATDFDAPVMGTVDNFPQTRIFFLGETNAIEQVPQPLTQNVVNWLFQ